MLQHNLQHKQELLQHKCSINPRICDIYSKII